MRAAVHAEWTKLRTRPSTWWLILAVVALHVLRRERLAQERTLKDVADAARISMAYLSEIERGRKEASSEVLAAAARGLGPGLADLLALGQDELARFAQARRARTRTASLRPRRRAICVLGAPTPQATTTAR